MNMNAFQIEMTRLTIQMAILEAIAFAAAMWMLYHVIRLGVREGLKESGLVDALKRRRNDSTTDTPVLFSKD